MVRLEMTDKGWDHERKAGALEHYFVGMKNY